MNRFLEQKPDGTLYAYGHVHKVSGILPSVLEATLSRRGFTRRSKVTRGGDTYGVNGANLAGQYACEEPWMVPLRQQPDEDQEADEEHQTLSWKVAQWKSLIIGILGKTRALTPANRRTYDQDAKAWREEDTDHALPDAEVALTCLRSFDDRVKTLQGNLEKLKETSVPSVPSVLSGPSGPSGLWAPGVCLLGPGPPATDSATSSQNLLRPLR